MQKLTGLPQQVQEEIDKLKKDKQILEEAGFKQSIYHSELEIKLGAILWALNKRDIQIKEALGWYEYYSENRFQFIEDYPEYKEEWKLYDTRVSYNSWLLRKAFEGLKYE